MTDNLQIGLWTSSHSRHQMQPEQNLNNKSNLYTHEKVYQISGQGSLDIWSSPGFCPYDCRR